MKLARLGVSVILAAMLVVGCSSDDDDDDAGNGVQAPESLAGRSYQLTISSGSGSFADTGTWEATFSETDNTYTVTGDQTNVADSAGTFTYSADGNQGTVTAFDSSSATLSIALTFSSPTEGTYSLTVETDTDSGQTGSFEEIQ